MNQLRRFTSLAREAAVIIGTIAGLVVLAAEAISAQGVIVDGNPSATVINIGAALMPVISGWLTRQNVYSKQSVAHQLGVPVKELCRKHGFSDGSYYLWRSTFGGMTVSDAKRLKELESENGRLKRLLADSLLENEVTREVLRKEW